MKTFSLNAKLWLVFGGFSIECFFLAWLGWTGASKDSFVIVAGLVTCLNIAFGFFILQQIRNSIAAAVQGLAENFGKVESASGVVADSAAKLSRSTTEQASALQQTAAATQELNEIVTRNTENAQRANSVSSTSQSSAMKGKEVVEEMTRAISEIDQSNQDIMNQVNESNRQISEITKVIAEIGNKTKVINDIVFQTKLLSFNASVEAARAGEHGKGFAVVAEEVGNLAQMSGTAAKEISEMLDSSIRKVESIVNDTKENVERLVRVGKDKVDAGRRVAEECAHVLDEIVGNVTDVSQMSSDIASASKDQAQGVREISKAMAQLDTVTQSNALAANIAAQAAEQISSQSTLLRGTVQSLMAIVDGGDANIQLSSYNTRPGAKTPTHTQTPVPAPRRAAPPSAPKSEPAKPNVVKFEPKKSPASRAESAAPVSSSAKTSAPIKLAAGADIEIPSENDPRFKDV